MTQNIQNRRQQPRFEIQNTFVVNPQGACEILEMSTDGFSFKCLFGQSLSSEWMVDIINDRGGYLENISVEKVWELAKDKDSYNPSSLCELAVGVKFTNLSRVQQLGLDNLLISNEKH
jgi:hypothetical protein